MGTKTVTTVERFEKDAKGEWVAVEKTVTTVDTSENKKYQYPNTTITWKSSGVTDWPTFVNKQIQSVVEKFGGGVDKPQ